MSEIKQSGLVVKLRGLLRKSGAPVAAATDAVRAIVQAAEVIIEVSSRPPGEPRYVIVERVVDPDIVTAKGVSLRWWTDQANRPRIVIAVPEPRKHFGAAKQALKKASEKLRRFQEHGLYAKRYRSEHEKTLAAMLADLERIEALSVSQDDGGAPPGGFAFFAQVAILWKHASGHFPPTSEVADGVHDTLVQLLRSISKKPLRGTSAETFEDAVSAAKREWDARDRAGEPPPTSGYLLKRKRRKRPPRKPARAKR